MSIYDERLWAHLERTANAEDRMTSNDKKIESGFLSGMRNLCDHAVELALTIRDMFPLYTRHDEVHICAVMRNMVHLLGDKMELLSRDETAILILAACYHDVGMSCSEPQALDLCNDEARIEYYLEEHPDVCARMSERKAGDVLPDDLLRDILRSVHHERTAEILAATAWPQILNGRIRRSDLSAVCESHGKDAEHIAALSTPAGPDLRMCAILLRLADILDFDSSRAPQAVYDYCGFHSEAKDRSAAFSKEEWEKHTASHGVFFELVENRDYPYDLPYRATSPSMQIEQGITSYLDWVDQEFSACRGVLRYCSEKWRNLILPRKIKREIEPTGYISGEFRFSLDQDRVLELLVGNELYQDPGVFVRELVQNAIDAVRTRQELDRYLPRSWTPQINIRSWMDHEGYHWFRIEDNGTGMDRNIIEKYFLKVGRSYYTSDDFQRDKYRSNANENYQPISRFGIGILSCFMGDKKTNRVEVSTLHYSDRSDALRMSMQGLTGYYYLASREKCPNALPMQGGDPQEQAPYRRQPGTSIAVRTNLYQKGHYHSFREILNQYVAYPPVPIHYEDDDGSYDYPTEQELMDAMHAVAPSDDPEKRGVLEFTPTPEQIREIEEKYPGLKILEAPKVVLKCECLDLSSGSGCLSGAVLLSKVDDGKAECRVELGEETVEPRIGSYLTGVEGEMRLNTFLRFEEGFSERLNAQKDMEILAKWVRYTETYSMTLCDLKEYSWYRSFWQREEWEKHISIAAHNGIRCGNAEFCLYDDLFTYTIADAVVLLKDRYRPELDVARSVIRKLPLAAAVEIEILHHEWRQQQFNFKKRSLATEDDWKISSHTYQKLMDERPDLVERLRFRTDHGVLSPEEIPGMLYRFSKLVIDESLGFFITQTDHYRHFCFAYLRKYYSLSAEVASVKNYKLALLPKRESEMCPGWETFPPIFFLPVEGDSEWLTDARRYNRLFCDEAHPLSQFLIRNRAKLEESVPGLFWEILESLAGGLEQEVISTVNECLHRIDALPGGRLKVPEEAFLIESDLY